MNLPLGRRRPSAVAASAPAAEPGGHERDPDQGCREGRLQRQPRPERVEVGIEDRGDDADLDEQQHQHHRERRQLRPGPQPASGVGAEGRGRMDPALGERGWRRGGRPGRRGWRLAALDLGPSLTRG